jgi:UDP-N-acetylmuramoyl-tripeptide--D-alanyl-D-alanine ligase
MKLAIENFSKMHGDKVLILGSMAELGKESEKEHRTLLEQITKYNWKDVALVGNEFQKISHSFRQFNNAEEVKDWLLKKKFENVSMLIKGSRSMQMEKALGE